MSNEFDMLMDAIASGKTFEEVKNDIKLLDEVKAEVAYKTMEANIRMLTPDGAIAIPQVVLYDRETGIAGTADLLIVTRDGKIKIVDLKTSKNFVRNLDTYEKGWDLKNDRVEKVKGKEVIIPGSLLKKKGVDKLSTREQHNLQVNLYRRMLENMGYEVDYSEFGASTFHFKVDVEGKGTDQKFLGGFEFDTWMPHPLSQNRDMVNMLIPSFVDPVVEQKMEEQRELSDDTPIEPKKMLEPTESMMDKLDAEGNTEYATISGALETYKLDLIKKQKAIEMIRSNVFMDRTKEQTQDYIINSLAAISVAQGEGPKARAALYTQFLRDGLKQVKNFTEYVEDPKNVGKPEYIGYVLNFNRFIETYRGLFTIKDSGDLNATQRSLVLNFQLELNKLITTDLSEGLVDQAITNYGREIIRSKSNRDFTKEDLDDLMIMGDDISYTEYLTGDMATSKDTILALMDKIYKAQKQKLLDRLELRDELIRQKAAKLQRLSPETDPQKLYHFMIEFDEEGVPTGQYVKRLGQKYSGIQKKLRDKLTNSDGQWKEYRDVTDITTASKEDIEYNQKLAEDKAAYADFFRAETKSASGKSISGNYHKYTDEFKKERDKYEYFVASGKHGFWKKRSTVSARQYAKYKAKFYESREYTRAIRKDGRATGQVIYGQTISAPKQKYRIAKDVARDGTVLTSDKYAAIMENTDTELGRAQKDFYETFIRLYEKELLEKLPMGQRGQMLGRIPLIKARLYQNLKEKPNIVTRLWTKMTRSLDNLINSTAQQKVILTDESGDLVDQMPIFYTGKPQNEEELANILNEIDQLNLKRKKGQIKAEPYKQQLEVLKGKQLAIQNTPSLGELNLDLGTALIKFNAMAEHYETMSEVEDTLKAMVKVLEKRTYGENKDDESNVVRRAKKWMHMVYYDNEKITKGFLEKVSDGLITASSLSYVAFNPFGNFNNYVLGRINNNIEMLGGRFFDKKDYTRASWEFNKRGITDLVQRTAMSSTLNKLGDIATFNALNLGKEDVYNSDMPLSKYEAFVDLYRMMDDKSDIRESGRRADKGLDSWFKKATEFGYILQDAAEYNVQTKVGMAMVMGVTMVNSKTGGELSLYDAMEFDGETQMLKLKEGYDQVKKKNGDIVDYNDDFRYELRNEIREVNKQIHGNYAAEDRMVMQSHAVGRLAAQFHKWVAPAIKARFREEYFDENLGWMEGRYRSFYQFTKYALGQVVQGNIDFTKYGKNFLEDYGFKGDKSQTDQKATNKLLNTYRVLGEIGIILSTVAISQILNILFTGDDDDSDFEKRMENFLMYQANRTYKELILMIPVAPDAWVQMYQMMKSPIAATRTMGEIGEAMSLTVRTPLAMLYYSDEEFRANGDFVYKRGRKKGQLKINKAWKDVLPVIYTLQKWDGYIREQDFFIK